MALFFFGLTVSFTETGQINRQHTHNLFITEDKVAYYYNAGKIRTVMHLNDQMYDHAKNAYQMLMFNKDDNAQYTVFKIVDEMPIIERYTLQFVFEYILGKNFNTKPGNGYYCFRAEDDTNGIYRGMRNAVNRFNCKKITKIQAVFRGYISRKTCNMQRMKKGINRLKKNWIYVSSNPYHEIGMRALMYRATMACN